MKKSKIFLSTGALVLAVTALFATKASKKFASLPVTTAKLSGTSIYLHSKGTAANEFLMTLSNDNGPLKATLDGLSISEPLVTAVTASPINVFYKGQ
jgi:hypothetical protein